MSPELIALVAFGVFCSAALYSSVGHGGGSGYLAVLALASVPAGVMRPAALLLNIGVSSIAAVAYLRRGAFSARVLWPFALAAIPFAFLGGRLDISGLLYKPLLAAVLAFSSWHLAFGRSQPITEPQPPPAIPPSLAAGSGMGMLAGLTGIGGGVFLSPLLIMKKLATTRQSCGVAAVFILLNSLAGLAGQITTVHQLPWNAMATWVPIALLGGFLGSRFGAHRAAGKTTYRILSVVLLIAVVKLLLTIGD
ncbi:MAG: sulfite exporter TauE/SafE family protein [Angustibacter sp.]